MDPMMQKHEGPFFFCKGVVPLIENGSKCHGSPEITLGGEPIGDEVVGGRGAGGISSLPDPSTGSRSKLEPHPKVSDNGNFV